MQELMSFWVEDKFQVFYDANKYQVIANKLAGLRFHCTAKELRKNPEKSNKAMSNNIKITKAAPTKSFHWFVSIDVVLGQLAINCVERELRC